MYSRQKTKIVATLGDPKLKKRDSHGNMEESSTYEKGLFNFNQEPMNDPSLQDIIDLLFEHGVDVIRINLAHIQSEFLRDKFREIKKAVLTAEKTHKRRVGVLADLPGPKIRFNQSNWLIPRKTLSVSFDEIEEKVTPRFKDADQEEANEAPAESIAQINLDDKAFSAASDEARLAVDIMLNEISARLDKIKEHPDQKLLAFIGDNDCTLEVQEVRQGIIVCKVISVRNGNRVVGRSKGFTIRGISKPISAFTLRDAAKLSAIFEVDFEDVATGGLPNERILSHIGISFCQTRDDVRKVLYHVIEECIKKHLNLPKDDLMNYIVEAPLMIAKIETEEGVKNIDEILDIADGAMVARGDLAVEIETSDLPRKSKDLINHCNLRGKPVIMATQMLESMKETIECTRPEATDVFGAVVDNVDALMLSGETSSGKYPAHAIKKMCSLSKNAETYVEERPVAGTNITEEYIKEMVLEDAQIQDHFHRLEKIKVRVQLWQDRWLIIAHGYSDKYQNGEITHEVKIFMDKLIKLKNTRLRRQHSTDRITHAACVMSVDPAVKGIVAPTTSGRTARMLSRFRPHVWILAQPHNQLTARKLTIDRGVMTIGILPVKKDSEEVDVLIKESREQFEEAINKNVTVIFTCGTPLGNVGTTNLILRWDAKETR